MSPHRALAVVSASLIAVSAVAVAPRPVAGAATPSFVQARAAEITRGRTNSVAFNTANAAGNLIVVSVFWDNTSSVSVADSRGNAYTSGGARRTWGSNRSAQVFYARSVAAGTNTVTATFIKAIRVTATVHVQSTRASTEPPPRTRPRGPSARARR